MNRGSPARLSSTLSLGALVIAVALFLGTALHQLHLPGFYYDEALDLTPMLHVMRGETPDLLRGIGLGRFPVMLLDYMGSLGGYLTVPFMWVFGPGYLSARAQPIFFSAVTIVLAWLLARRWFGDGVAALTALLLAVHPSFVWFSRQGISVTSVMTVFSLGSLLLLDGALRDPQRRSTSRTLALVFLAGVLIGLGLWAKFLFFRWMVVLAAIGLLAWLLCGRPALPWATRWAGALIAGFVFGAFPLIYYNAVGLIRDGSPWTFTLLLNSLTQPTQQFGVNNLDVITNLRKAVEDVRVFLDGSYFWYNGVPFSNVYAVPALLVSAGVGSVLAFRRPVVESTRFFALLLGIVILTALGAFTVSGLWSTHQFIMLPLPQLVVACAAVWSAQTLSNAALDALRVRRAALASALSAGLAVAFVALPFSRDMWVNEQHHQTLARTGGSGRFSDAVYKLAGWLDAQRIAQPIALDWGIERNVRVLTADRVRPIEIFGFTPEPDEGFRQRALAALQDPERYYIVLWDRFAVYNRRQAFTDLAHQIGRDVVEVFIAHERSGLPVYVVLQVKPQ